MLTAFIAGLVVGAAIGALCTHYYGRHSCMPAPKSGGGPGEEPKARPKSGGGPGEEK